MKINQHTLIGSNHLTAAKNYLSQKVEKNMEVSITKDPHKEIVIKDKESGSVLKRIKSDLVLSRMTTNEGNLINQKV